MEPTFSIAYRCDECREQSDYLDDVEQWRRNHIELHREGSCFRCRHWRREHKPATQSMREYLGSDQPVVCIHHMGMGDFCGCPVE